MDFLKNLFKRNKKPEADNMAVVKRRLARNQEAVFRAVLAINRPCTGRMVSDQMGWDSASVTNRLAELHHKGRIQVAYRKKGLDGMWRQYYVVAAESK